MELAKIRSLSDEELEHQEKTTAEQLFRLRFQVSLGQNDGVKKLRQLRNQDRSPRARTRQWRRGRWRRGSYGKQEGSPLNDGD
jgi:large subunit ribosomal protein L29